jgi:hypothetical protein
VLVLVAPDPVVLAAARVFLLDHLWQNKDGAWKITRVLSYDHHALPK